MITTYNTNVDSDDIGTYTTNTYTDIDSYSIHASTVCTNCNTRQATEIWSNCSLCFARGYYEHRCKQCVLEAQVTHSREQAALLSEREAALDKLIREKNDL